MKKIFIIVIIFLLLLIIGIFIFFNKKDSNYSYVQNENDLSKIENNYKLNRINEKSKILAQVVLYPNYINEFIDYDSDSVKIKNMKDDKIIKLTHNFISGGEAICYTKKFMEQKVYDIFHIKIGFIDNESTYYTIKNGHICFEEAYLNSIDSYEIKDKEEKNDKITIDIYNKDFKEDEWSFEFEENQGYYYLKEASRISS